MREAPLREREGRLDFFSISITKPRVARRPRARDCQSGLGAGNRGDPIRVPVSNSISREAKRLRSIRRAGGGAGATLPPEITLFSTLVSLHDESPYPVMFGRRPTSNGAATKKSPLRPGCSRATGPMRLHWQ